jgi:AhpD family alkylhydroperoxidase
MSKDFKDISHNVIKGIGALQESHPDLMKSFGALSTAATKTNALDMKTKELMALAVGITSHCDGCVAFHTKKALELGTSREEVVETIGLAIYMGGGPAVVYGADALTAYDQFSAP